MCLTLDKTNSLSLNIQGVVQGVGFRPFIYQLAKTHSLAGWVCNRSGDVAVKVEGSRRSLEHFLSDITVKAPPLAKIQDIKHRYSQTIGHMDFEIRKSRSDPGGHPLISSDVGVCPRCLSDISDPRNRRYRYPFTNCTDCGPRFTIIKKVPYDRKNTTMHAFRMCPECRSEYEDPLNRRFHAQPNACPKCGPELVLTSADGPIVYEDPVCEAAKHIKKGSIVALKGLGGVLLACDATNSRAVNRLRDKKNRPSKPFAVMMQTVEEIKEHCRISQIEADILNSSLFPIVLLKRTATVRVCPEVAPGLNRLGVMLPYTPLHRLLMNDVCRPLVMTSGNLNQLPIIKDNKEALDRLAAIADLFLLHDRDIFIRSDDSVVEVDDDTPRVIRRSRGYAPSPIHLSFKSRHILACGADLKNTFCLAREEYAFLSQHIGDLENMETFRYFEDAITHYRSLFRVRPKIVACDCHPDYVSSRYARRYVKQNPEAMLVPVQHHHAHVVSCMIDNRAASPVLGVAFDGTGYGSDGHVWGGEFLLADEKHFKRLGHLEYVPLPGGEAAILNPCRMAVSYLYTLLGDRAVKQHLSNFQILSDREVQLTKRMIRSGINSPLTSSAGRLFDGVSALIGVRTTVDYEAQAAMELETAAEHYIKGAGTYPFDIHEICGASVIRLGKVFRSILKDLARGVDPGEISARFHKTVAEMILRMCKLARRAARTDRVVLSGGVFQNRLLSECVVADLEGAGFNVYRHTQVPCNDGGISLGQAVVAHHVTGGNR